MLQFYCIDLSSREGYLLLLIPLIIITLIQLIMSVLLLFDIYFLNVFYTRHELLLSDKMSKHFQADHPAISLAKCCFCVPIQLVLTKVCTASSPKRNVELSLFVVSRTGIGARLVP